MKRLLAATLILALFVPLPVPADPSVSDDAPSHRQMREGNRRAKYRFKEYRHNTAPPPVPSTPAPPAASLPAGGTAAEAAYRRYLDETDPRRKEELFQAYVRILRGEKTVNASVQRLTAPPAASCPVPAPAPRQAASPTPVPSGNVRSALPARPAWMAPIPQSGYLQDTPPTPPPAVTRRKKRGLAKIFRSLEDNLEKTLGATISSTMELTYGLNKDPELHQRLQRVASMIDRVHDRNMGIRYKLLNMDVVNAFAVPGGTVYLTPKMLRFVNSDSELAFVVGHEVGHIVARHSMKQFEKGLAIDYLIRKTKMDNQEALRIANAFLALQYSRQNEFEADRYGFQYLSAAGYNPYAAVSFMNKMKTAFEQKKSPKVFTYFSTHPSLHDRFNRNLEMYRGVAAQNPLWRSVNGQ